MRAQVTAPVPESWRAALERLAARNGRTVADELRAALQEHFAEHEEPYQAPVALAGQLSIGQGS